MPLYSLQCPGCDKRTSIFRKIADRDIQTLCICGEIFDRVIEAPAVRGDIEPYQSPATGKIVQSRAQRRDDLKRSGCIEWEPGIKEQVARNKKDRLEQDVKKFEPVIDEIATAFVSTLDSE